MFWHFAYKLPPLEIEDPTPDSEGNIWLAGLSFLLAGVAAVMTYIPATRLVALIPLALAGSTAAFARFDGAYPNKSATAALITVGITLVGWSIALALWGTAGMIFYNPNAPQRKPSLVELGD